MKILRGRGGAVRLFAPGSIPRAAARTIPLVVPKAAPQNRGYSSCAGMRAAVPNTPPCSRSPSLLGAARAPTPADGRGPPHCVLAGLSGRKAPLRIRRCVPDEPDWGAVIRRLATFALLFARREWGRPLRPSSTVCAFAARGAPGSCFRILVCPVLALAPAREPRPAARLVTDADHVARPHRRSLRSTGRRASSSGSIPGRAARRRSSTYIAGFTWGPDSGRARRAERDPAGTAEIANSNIPHASRFSRGPPDTPHAACGCAANTTARTNLRPAASGGQGPRPGTSCCRPARPHWAFRDRKSAHRAWFRFSPYLFRRALDEIARLRDDASSPLVRIWRRKPAGPPIVYAGRPRCSPRAGAELRKR